MNYFSRLYHFFGGLYFALGLIGASALFVVAGTFIESSTQSHRYAAAFTYGNPIFALLLWGFFINILFAATRRWPFQVRHIPFLITHLGLLMILGGVLIKLYFGVQGSMSLIEGSASHEIFETGSYAIHVEKRGASPIHYALKNTLGGGFDSFIADTDDGLVLRLASFHPHSTEWLATWIKGDLADISGLQPMPVYNADVAASDTHLPISGKVRFFQSSLPCSLYAIRSSQPAKIIDQLYKQNAHLHLVERSTGKLLVSMPLDQSLQKSMDLGKYGMASFKTELAFSAITGFDDPHLQMQLDQPTGSPLLMKIPLDGSFALLNMNLSTPYLGSLPVAVDIESIPLLALIEDDHRDVHLMAVDTQGQIWWRSFRSDNLDTLLAYDDGFGGYAVQAELPFNLETAIGPSREMQDFESESFRLGGEHSQKVKAPPNRSDYSSKDCVYRPDPIAVCRFKDPVSGRVEREAALNHRLAEQLRLAILQGIELSPPLQLWKEACQSAHADFADTLLTSYPTGTAHIIGSILGMFHSLLNLRLYSPIWIGNASLDTNVRPANGLWISLNSLNLRCSRDKTSLSFCGKNNGLSSQHWKLSAHKKGVTAEETASFVDYLYQQIFAAAELCRRCID